MSESEFTKSELASITNVFVGLKFSPGQRDQMTLAENIINKCSKLTNQIHQVEKANQKQPIKKGEQKQDSDTNDK